MLPVIAYGRQRKEREGRPDALEFNGEVTDS